jgi:hypothetical protein
MAEPTHSYYDWQLSTLLLAHDAVAPLPRHDNNALGEREQAVQKELYQLVHQTLPEAYKQNPQAEFPPEVVILLTKATLRRACEIAGFTVKA